MIYKLRMSGVQHAQILERLSHVGPDATVIAVCGTRAGSDTLVLSVREICKSSLDGNQRAVKAEGMRRTNPEDYKAQVKDKYIICPCGCGETLYMNLQRDRRPCWRFTVDRRGTATLHPSVWRQVGCRSHFFLRRGVVQWAMRDAAYRDG